MDAKAFFCVRVYIDHSFIWIVPTTSARFLRPGQSPGKSPADWQGYRREQRFVAGVGKIMVRSKSSVILIAADAICDANLSVTGSRNSPAALLVEQSGQTLRVLGVDSLDRLESHPAAANATRIDRPGCVILPGLVNAHTHLDLTHIGPRPHDPNAGFVAWVDMVRAERHTSDEQIANSVRQGCDLLKKGGVSIVGDIAGAAGGQP
ncbi:MAG: hypothetical protein ACIARQ_12015, partial [Phycisphaerales bacterium JB061]